MRNVYKIMVGALLVILITNPASGAVILDLVESGFKLIFQFGSPINFAASGVLAICIGYLMWNGREKTHIPKKTAHTKGMGKYVET